MKKLLVVLLLVIALVGCSKEMNIALDSETVTADKEGNFVIEGKYEGPKEARLYINGIEEQTINDGEAFSFSMKLDSPDDATVKVKAIKLTDMVEKSVTVKGDVYRADLERQEVEKQAQETLAAKEAEEKAAADFAALPREEQIEKLVRDRASDQYNNLDITSISVNKNLGDPESDTFIVLVRGDFTIANRIKTANEVLEMYMKDVPAWLWEHGADDIAEVAVFVKDKHNNRDLKISFEKVEKGFQVVDKLGF